MRKRGRKKKYTFASQQHGKGEAREDVGETKLAVSRCLGKAGISTQKCVFYCAYFVC